MCSFPKVPIALALRSGVVGLLASAALQTPVRAAAAPAPAGSNLYMSTVGVPIISNGRLVNYIMVRLDLSLIPGTDVSRMSAKEPYFREALVRLAYRTHLNPSNNFNKVDPAIVGAKMLPLCQAIVGPVVTSVAVRYQAPEKWLEPPTSAKAAAPGPSPDL